MRTARRYVLLLPLALLLVGVAPVSGADPVTLRVATASDPGELAIREEIVARFEALHPHIKVELIPITNRVDEQLVRLLAGLPLDILYLNPNFFGYFVRQGFLEDLRPYVTRDGFPLDQLYPALVAQMGDGDHLYAMPFELTSIAMLYNESLFSEAGLAAPPREWNSDAWNWSVFREYATRLTRDVDNDGTPDRWGVGLILGALDQIVYPWVFANGGSVFDVATGAFRLSEPAAAEALQFLADLLTRDRVAIGPWVGLGHFTSETVAMLPFGRWLSPIGDVPFDWNVIPLPKGKQAASMIVWLAYGMSSTSQHKDEAWEFLKFLVSEEPQLLNAARGQALSVLSPLAAHPDLRFAEPAGHYQVFAEAIQYAYPVPYADNDRQISNIIWNALVPVWGGQVDAWTAMAQVKDAIENLLDENSFRLLAPDNPR